MKYKITKEQCQKNIKSGNVCSQCGGIVTPLDTVDNSNDPTFWSGCEKCFRFDTGVSKKVYEIAKTLVEDRNYEHYSHIQITEKDNESMVKYKTECQISGVCGIVIDILNINEVFRRTGKVKD